MHISKLQWFYIVMAFILIFYFLTEIFHDIVIRFVLSLIGLLLAIPIVNFIEKPK